MFSLPNSVSINGIEYRIRTDFRVILEIFVMLDDPDLKDADKTEALLRMFYVDLMPSGPQNDKKAYYGKKNSSFIQ